MKTKTLVASTLLLALSACTRVETGEVGVRVGFDKQINLDELPSGTINQTIVGSVLTFPYKDVEVEVNDMRPLAKDNSTLADFDVSVIYSLNPATIAELYVEKSKGFHRNDPSGDIYLMYQYVYQVTRNAAYKAARNYEGLAMADNRNSIEAQIQDNIIVALEKEGLADKISINQVMVRQIMPDKEIVQSANELVKSQNELKRKTVEVETAKKEAERIAVLNANKGAIEYMNAMALMNISEGVRDGKVQTIIVPQNFDALMLK